MNTLELIKTAHDPKGRDIHPYLHRHCPICNARLLEDNRGVMVCEAHCPIQFREIPHAVELTIGTATFSFYSDNRDDEDEETASDVMIMVAAYKKKLANKK